MTLRSAIAISKSVGYVKSLFFRQIAKCSSLDSATSFYLMAWTFAYSDKAELPQVGILFRTQFPSLVIFINKKVGFQKTKTS